MKILMIVLMPLMMFAHALSVTASFEEQELFIESFYTDGTACKGCIFDVKKDGNEIYKGRLDDEGAFEETVEIVPPFDVHIDGGMGHWADVKIDGSEMGEPINTISSNANAMNGIDEAKLRQIIRSELNKQNGKIEAMVEKNKSNLEKMLVGLGYILGIFGLWQLFMKRQQK